MIHGENLILAIDGTAIAASKECSLELQQDYITSCNPTNGRTTKKIPTRYDWGLSANGLVASTDYADSLVSLLVTGTVLTVRFYDSSLGINRQGYAIVDSLSIGAPFGNISTYSIKLQGSGPLENMGLPLTFGYVPGVSDGTFLYGPANDTISITTGNSPRYCQFRCPSGSTLHITQTGTVSILMRGDVEEYTGALVLYDATPFNNATKRVYAGTSTTILTLQAGIYTLFCNEDEDPTARLVTRQ